MSTKQIKMTPNPKDSAPELVFWYEMPHQVKYVWGDATYLGIAFHEWIIDLRTGRPHFIGDLLRRDDLDADDIIVEYGDWWPLKVTE